MEKRIQWRGVLAAVFGTMLASACGSNGGEVSLLRVVNAAPALRAADYVLGNSDDPFADDLGYLQYTEYEQVDSVTHDVRIESSDSPTPLYTVSESYQTNTDYTAFIVGSTEASVRSITVVDDNEKPSSGYFKVRVAHLAPSLESVDIYVTNPGADLGHSVPVFKGLTYRKVSQYVFVRVSTQGQFEIRATVRNTNAVVYDSGTLTIDEGDIHTLALADDPDAVRRPAGLLVPYN